MLCIPDKNTNILLPIVYDKGFTSNVELKEVYNTFIGVPLTKGKNNIVITKFTFVTHFALNHGTLRETFLELKIPLAVFISKVPMDLKFRD